MFATDQTKSGRDCAVACSAVVVSQQLPRGKANEYSIIACRPPTPIGGAAR